ncbi:MAG: tetratricopeptide repeat protein [Microcoleus vaginatus WJT46-NPBG5]|jgi:CHAT domain-containing protein/Flp pilus assembly protein TadD|nr:tetratricopeptide repeat protein [Microcoleus vaginatus WJT46-NPBG5]
MRLKRFFSVASTTVLLIASQTLKLNVPVPVAMSPVVAQTVNEGKAEAYKLVDQGLQQIYASQPEAALSYFQKALTIYRQINDRRGEGQALGNLGLAYLLLVNYPKAIEYFQQDLAIAREIKDSVGEAQALGNLGLAYSKQGNQAKAVEFFEKSLEIARAIKDPQAEGNALGNLGLIYEAQSEYDKAIEYYERALIVARQINPLTEGGALFILGNAYTNRGQYTKAVQYYKQAISIFREIKNKELEWKSLLGIGGAFLYLGDYVKAIDYFQQSLAVTSETRNQSNKGYVLNVLGQAYMSLGDYSQAIEYFQQSLAIAKAIKDSGLEASILNGLGNTSALLGDYSKAVDYLQKSVSIAQTINQRKDEGTYLGNLGINYTNLGKYTEAIDYLQQSLAIARAIKDREGEGRTLGNLGIAYLRLKEYSKAIEHFQQDLEISQEIGNLPGQGRALNNLGLALFESGNLAEAEKILRQGMEARESLREILGDNDPWKVSIFEQQARTYHLLQQVLIAQNKTDAALEISERGRTRAFVELLAKRLSPEPETSTIPSPLLADIKNIAQQQNATLVEYSLALDQQLFIWVITPTGTVTFRSVDLKSLKVNAGTSPIQKLVSQALESLGIGEDRNGIFEVTVINPTANPQGQIQSLKQLHQVLIQPIADLLPADPNEPIIFIPHQALFLVPFPALIDLDGKYLVEKHTILTAPSIQILALTHQQRQNVSRSRQGALVVGNPSPMPAGFSPLLGAEKEAKQVAQLLNTQPLIGSQATKSAVLQQLSNARIIHLATHGIYNEQQPLEGAIALAAAGNDSQNNGLLTAEEIFNFDRRINAELLVLSACNTGRGKITGDGVIGLSRSFITAGVPSIIVSLWAVPDAPTAELMSEFYTNLNQKQLDKAQALRQAMLKMMAKHPNNPRAWAAFTLIGEAE